MLKEVFYVLILIVTIQSLHQIFKEITNKTYFSKNFTIINRNSILLDDLFLSNYTLIDAIFDFWYIAKNWKKEFIAIFCITIILLSSFWWIPTIYLIILIISTLILITKILTTLALGKEAIIDCDDQFILFKGNMYKIKRTLIRPYINSKILIYFIISKKNKFNPEVTHTILLNKLLPKPLWFLKIIIHTSGLLYRTAKSDEMRRKNIRGKLDVISKTLSVEWEFYLLKKAGLNNIARGKRIIVKERAIRTNFITLNQMLLEYKIYMEGGNSLKPALVKFKGVDHYAALNNKIGVHYTTQERVKIGGEGIETLKIPLSPYKQHLLCGFYGVDIIEREGFPESFFNRHGIKNEEDFANFWLKQQIFLESATSSNLLFQEKSFSKIIKLHQEITLQAQLFMHNKFILGHAFCPKEAAVKLWEIEKPGETERKGGLEILEELSKNNSYKIPEKYIKPELLNESRRLWEDINK